MSNIATGVAAGVAATTQTADQLRKERNKRLADRQAQRDAPRIEDIVEAKLRGLEDQDEAGENGSAIRIDAQLNSPQKPTPESAPGKSSQDPPHIDVTA